MCATDTINYEHSCPSGQEVGDQGTGHVTQKLNIGVSATSEIKYQLMCDQQIKSPRIRRCDAWTRVSSRGLDNNLMKTRSRAGGHFLAMCFQWRWKRATSPYNTRGNFYVDIGGSHQTNVVCPAVVRLMAQKHTRRSSVGWFVYCDTIIVAATH